MVNILELNRVIETIKKKVEEKKKEEQQQKVIAETGGSKSIPYGTVIVGGSTTPIKSEQPSSATKTETTVYSPKTPEELIDVISYVPPTGIGYDPSTGKTIPVTTSTKTDTKPDYTIPVVTQGKPLADTDKGVAGGTATPSQLPWTYEGAKTVAETGGTLPDETTYEATQRIQEQNLDKWSNVGTDEETMRLQRGHFVGYDKEGKPIYIPESPYQVKHGYTPVDTDYATVETGLASQKAEILGNIGQITDVTGKASENINLIRENLGVLQSQIELVSKYPKSTIFTLTEENIGQTGLQDLYPEVEGLQIKGEELFSYLSDVKEENVKALEQNLGVISSGKNMLPLLGEQLKTVEQTEFTVGKYKELGYKVDILEQDIGSLFPSVLQQQIQTQPVTSYQFSLPLPTEVHKNIFGGTEGIALTASAFLESPFAIKTIGSGIQQLITGDTKIGETRYKELSEYSLGLHHGLDTGTYGVQVLGSGAMVEGVYIPLATIGAFSLVKPTGSIVSAKISQFKPLSITSKFSPTGQKILQTGFTYGKTISEPFIATGKAGGLVLGSRLSEPLLVAGMYGVMEMPRQISILSSSPERFGGEFAESLFRWGIVIGAAKTGLRTKLIEPSVKPSVGKVYSPDDPLSRFFESSRMQKMVKGYPFETSYPTPIRTAIYSRLRPVYLKLKELVREPGWELVTTKKAYSKPFDYRPFGSWSRESIISREQLIGKRMDPFATKYPSGVWGGYETSWTLYRSTLLPQEIGHEYLGYKTSRIYPKGSPFDSFQTWKPKVKALYIPETGESILLESPWEPPVKSEIKVKLVDTRFVEGKSFDVFFEPRTGTIIRLDSPFTKYTMAYESGKPSFTGFRGVDWGEVSGVYTPLKGKTSPLRFYGSMEQYGIPSSPLDLETRGWQGVQKIIDIKSSVRGTAIRYTFSTTRTTGVSLPSDYAMAYGYTNLSTLEWLEEGTQYVHPYWGQKAVEKPSLVITKTGLKLGGIVGTLPKPKTETISTSITGLIDINKIGTIEKYDINNILRTDVERKNIYDVGKKTETSLGLTLGLNLGTIQSQAQQQLLLQEQQTQLKTITMLDLTTSAITDFYPTEIPTVIEPVVPIIPILPTLRGRKLLEGGFSNILSTTSGGARKRVHPVKLLFKNKFRGLI